VELKNSKFFIWSENKMDITENLKDLLTPREVEEKKILSQTTQWRERNAHRLKFYKIGNKILYSPKHLEDYFEACESNKVYESQAA